MMMDSFLRKHDVDIGKTFGILLFAAAIRETYGVFFDLLYHARLNLSFNILIFLALASGMYRHSNTSRQWCVGLTWLTGIALILITVAAAFTSGDSIRIRGEKFPDPPIWKLILTNIALLPGFWIAIRALTCAKAKEEFKAAEQAHTEATSETAQSAGESAQKNESGSALS
jgi:hypothetical protein